MTTVARPVIGVEDLGEGIGKYLIYLGDGFLGHITVILYNDDRLDFGRLHRPCGRGETGAIFINEFC